MKVPLLLYTVNKKVFVVKNSELYEYDLPFNPYILYPSNDGLCKYKLIPTGKEVQIGKREYTTTFEADIAAYQLNKSKTPHHYLKYNEQLFIEQENYVLQHENSDELKTLVFDIEVASYGNGLFPKAKTNPIIAIGCKFNNEEIKIFSDYKEGLEDYIIVNDFLKYVQSKNPDIITGYNSKRFDIEYIVERCKIKGLDYNKLARFKSKIFNKKNEIVIKNRIHFDVYDHVVKDQTLMGIKSHKMKDVANWRKLPDVIELEDDEIKNTWKLFNENKPRLIKYLESDVKVTYQLSKGYLNNSIRLAEFIKAPLDNIINSYASFIPKIICGRHFRDLGYVALDRNHERYNEQTGKYFKTGFKYEGAIVAINKYGFFPKVWKLDFSSQYPSSIITWNISPETTRIHKMTDYTGEFLIKKQNDILWLSIPDKNFNKQVIISIDQSKDGFLKKYQLELLDIRKDLKDKQKEAIKNKDKTKEEEYLSRQWGIKIIQNSIYGFLPQEFASYGDLGCGIAIAGTCRWVNQYVQTLLDDKIIELDTDGYYIDFKVDTETINKKVREEIKNKFDIKESRMILELDEFDQGFFYRMKNYILREKGKTIFHGVSFKSSRHPGLYDKALNKLANSVLDNTGNISEKVLEDIKNLNNYEIKDFLSRIRINKDPKTYDNPNSFQCILMDQVKYVLKRTPELNDQIEYFVTVNPASVPDVLKKLQNKKTKGDNHMISQLVTDKSQLNMEYYEKEIEKVIKLFKSEEESKEKE